MPVSRLPLRCRVNHDASFPEWPRRPVLLPESFTTEASPLLAPSVTYVVVRPLPNGRLHYSILMNGGNPLLSHCTFRAGERQGVIIAVCAAVLVLTLCHAKMYGRQENPPRGMRIFAPDILEPGQVFPRCAIPYWVLTTSVARYSSEEMGVSGSWG